MKHCTIRGCNKRYEARGLCPMHYRRLRLNGSPDVVLIKTWDRLEDKLLEHIEFPQDYKDCWLWKGLRANTGYGKFYWKGKDTSAHRAMYKAFVDADVDGLHVDHLCRNPPCVNLLHLEAVTGRENTLRGISPPAINILKTHCPKGHPYDFKNTRVSRKTGGRACRECSRAAYREYYYKRQGTEATGKWSYAKGRIRK